MLRASATLWSHCSMPCLLAACPSLFSNLGGDQAIALETNAPHEVTLCVKTMYNEHFTILRNWLPFFLGSWFMAPGRFFEIF